jgi:hypothetical protein
MSLKLPGELSSTGVRSSILREYPYITPAMTIFFSLEMQLPIVNKRRRYVLVSVISTDEERAIWIWNWPASEKIMSGS